MFKKTLCLLVYSALFFLSNKTFAAKYYVNNTYNAASDVYSTIGGNNANNGLTPSTPKLTLANVLSTYSASFVAGDTIFVDAGTYSDKDLSSPLNGVVIKGAGITKTIFANPGSDNYFMRINDDNTVLMDIKLSGFDDAGGGTGQCLGIENNITGVKIINVHIDGCRQSSDLSGYPIEVNSGASVEFNGGGLTCNSYTAGGGIHTTSATVVIRNYQFLGNERDQGWATIGASLHINGGSVNVYNTRFEQNEASGDGQCPGLYMTAGTVIVYDSKFDKNVSWLSYDRNGACIYITGGTFKIARSIISANTQSGGSKTLSGGISVSGGTATIDSCLFSGNIGKNVSDVYSTNGSVIANNCKFGSPSPQIQDNGTGTFTISNCGNPGELGTAVVRTNTTNPTYTANPTLPSYLNQTCVTVPCTAPSISSVASSNSVCSGNTFISNITSASSPVTYTWTSSAQAGISGNTASGTGDISDVLINNTTGDLTATYSITPSSGACVGTSTNFVVTVTPKPSVEASALTYAICNGSSASLNASGSGTSYSWSPSTGLSATTGTNVSATVTVNATYTVTSSTAGGCTNTDTVNLTIKSLPSVTASTTNYAICNGSSAVLQATGTGGNTYSWSPSTALNISNGSTVTTTTTSNIVYTVTATGTNGCVNSDTVNITVKSLPNIVATALATPICNGASTTITGSGGNSYSWYPNTNLSSNTGTSITANPTSGIIYTVTGTSLNGCTNTDTATIVVLNNDDATFTFSPFTQCITGANPIPVVNTPGGVFSGSSGLIINPSTGEVDLAGSGVGSYTITYQTPNTNNCPSDTTFAFQITNGYIADFSYMPDTVCDAGNNITAILGTNANHGLYTSYPPGLVFSNPSFGEINPNLSTPGTYTIVNTISASGTCMEQKDSTEITILQLPNSSLTGTPASVCYGANVLNLTPVVNGGIYSGNGVSGNSFNPTIAGVGTHVITYSIDTLIGNTTCSSSTNFNITVNPQPDASFIGMASPVCDGSSSQGLSAITAGGVFSGTGIVGNNFDPSVSGAGTFDITYTVGNAFNCSDSSTQQITVNALPIITDVYASNALEFCAGEETYLVVTSADSIVNYSWIPGNINNDSLFVNTSGNYTVYITDTNNCSNASASTSVIVNPLPETPVITAVGPTNVCFGDSVLLIAQSNGATDFYWSPYGGNNDSLYVSAIGNDTFFVYTGNVHKCSSFTSEDSIAVNIFSLVGSPLLSAPQGNTACSGDSVLLVATSVGAYNYTWSPLGINNDSIYVSATGNFDYSVSVSSTYNCASNGSSDTVSVSVFALPSIPLININSDTTACEGETIMIVATSNGANQFNWTPSSANNDTIYVTAVGSNNYFVGVTNSNGCAALNNSDSIIVTINAAPSTPVLTTPNGSTACEGDSVLVVASSTGANNYTWTPSNLNNDSIYLTNVGVYNLSIQVSNNNNCASLGASNNVTAEIYPRPTDPTLNINNDTTACEGETIMIVATSNDANQFNWTPASANNDTIYVSAVGSNNYFVGVTNSNGCAALNNSDSVLVTINAAPSTPVIATPNGSTACEGDSVLVVASSIEANNYTWTPNNLNNDSIYIAAVGTYNYQVEVSSLNNCAAAGTSNNVAITISPKQILNANSDTTLCKGSSIGLNGSNGNTYSWYALNGGANIVNSNIQNTSAVVVNDVIIVLTDASNNCSENDTVYVYTFVNPLPVLSATPTAGNDPLPVLFSFANPASFNSFVWNFGDNTDSSLNASPNHVYEFAGTYNPTLYFITNDGCKDSVSLEIVVNPLFDVVFPNVFTPNGDEKNDIFYIKIRNGKLVYTEIYDRWGLMMYEQAGENVYWDGYTMGGQLASVGVYYFIITIEKFDGTTEKYTGSFSLFR